MKLKTLIAAAVLAVPLAAIAAGKPGSAEAEFKALDKNKDGFITPDEAAGTPYAKDFNTLDKNRDGKLSRPEHAAAAAVVKK